MLKVVLLDTNILQILETCGRVLKELSELSAPSVFVFNGSDGGKSIPTFPQETLTLLLSPSCWEQQVGKRYLLSYLTVLNMKHFYQSTMCQFCFNQWRQLKAPELRQMRLSYFSVTTLSKPNV